MATPAWVYVVCGELNNRYRPSTTCMLHTFQRIGERFLDLKISSVLVVAMDVTLETPPPEVAITLPTLPAIVLLPGDDKVAPFRCE